MYVNVFRDISPSLKSDLLLLVWGFYGGDYKEWCLQGCYAVWLS
jgi:hypothetical protein